MLAAFLIIMKSFAVQQFGGRLFAAADADVDVASVCLFICLPR